MSTTWRLLTYVRRTIVRARLRTLLTVLGTALAIAASWVLVRFVFELPFAPPWLDLLGLAAATLLLTALLGGTSAHLGLARSPRAALREADLRGAG